MVSELPLTRGRAWIRESQILGLLLRRHVKRWRVPELELSAGVDHVVHRSLGVVDELTLQLSCYRTD